MVILCQTSLMVCLAKAFNDELNFDGVALTKLDGDTRGGAALTIRSRAAQTWFFIRSIFNSFIC